MSDDGSGSRAAISVHGVRYQVKEVARAAAF
jgi:hypothetical protein